MKLKMRKIPSILFVSHEASLTGAPASLFNLVRWLSRRKHCRPYFLFLKGGRMLDRFRQLGSVAVLEEPGPFLSRLPGSRYFLNRIRTMKLVDAVRIRLLLKAWKLDMIYLNTAVSAVFWNEMKSEMGNGSIFQLPVIAHIHELKTIIDTYIGRKKFISATSEIDHYITVSGGCADNLKKNYQICEDKISIIGEPVNVSDINRKMDKNRENSKLDFFRKQGIREDDFIVAGSGLVQWRKGADLFLNTAMKVNLASKVHFVWIGDMSRHDRAHMEYDIVRMNLDGRVHFTGEVSDIVPYLNRVDLFFLSSREDPCPLVLLEAAALGKPLLCFEKSGGASEMSDLNGNAGYLVPYGDTNAAAERIIELFNEPARCSEMGLAAKHMVCKEHDIDIIGRKILEIIKTQHKKFPSGSMEHNNK